MGNSPPKSGVTALIVISSEDVITEMGVTAIVSTNEILLIAIEILLIMFLRCAS